MPSSVHISLNVSDLSRSVDFYRRFLGEPRKLKVDYAKFVGEEPEIHLALQPGEVRGSGALSHLGIRVDSPEAGPALEERAGRPRPPDGGREARSLLLRAAGEILGDAIPTATAGRSTRCSRTSTGRPMPATTCCQPKASAPGSEERGKASLPAACC